MNEMLLVHLFDLPSVQAFIKNVGESLLDNQSVVLLMPGNLDASEVWFRISATFIGRDTTYQIVYLDTDSAPVKLLSDALTIEWPQPETPRTIANLIRCGGLPDVIYLDGFDRLPADQRPSWVKLLDDWGRYSHQLADEGRRPPALCMIAPPGAFNQLPNGDIHVKLVRWWGFPSALEMQLLYRLARDHQPFNAAAVWQEYLLPALVGSNLSLLDYLSRSNNVASLDQLRICLKQFGDEYGWSEDVVRQASEWLPRHREAEEVVCQPEGHRFWSEELIWWTPEYGLELHTAALLLLGREKELAHRLWRGQSRLILPIIDEFRLRLCLHFLQTYGDDWHLDGELPRNSDEAIAPINALSVEWGVLVTRIRKHSQLKTARSKFQFPAEVAHQMRNKIAHYVPISLDEFEQLNRQIKSLAVDLL